MSDNKEETKEKTVVDAVSEGATHAAVATGDALKSAGDGFVHAVTHPGETAKKAVDATILSPYGTNVDGRIDTGKAIVDTFEAVEKNQTK